MAQMAGSFLDLMHDVSLRAASNRMDAHNFAVVLCPTSSRAKRTCSDPGESAPFTPSPNSTPASRIAARRREGFWTSARLRLQQVPRRRNESCSASASAPRRPRGQYSDLTRRTRAAPAPIVSAPARDQVRIYLLKLLNSYITGAAKLGIELEGARSEAWMSTLAHHSFRKRITRWGCAADP
ncbi:hypothetical protein K438DRAFT_2026161 [Mycena galopus ATCC 62051]|nr:hypothetical protein K438DRAFT_2026161 [Mycena galopus ATCC 62051]